MEFTPSIPPSLQLANLYRCTVTWPALKTKARGTKHGPWVKPVAWNGVLGLIAVTLHLNKKIDKIGLTLGLYPCFWIKLTAKKINVFHSSIPQSPGDSEEIWWRCEFLSFLGKLQEWVWDCQWRTLAGWEINITLLIYFPAKSFSQPHKVSKHFKLFLILKNILLNRLSLPGFFLTLQIVLLSYTVSNIITRQWALLM